MAHDSGSMDDKGWPGGADPREFLRRTGAFAKGKAAEVVLTPLPKAAAPGKKGAHAGLPSIISVNVELGGQIVSPEELHIYGTIEGDVRATSLIVCPGGAVHGDVVADSVTVQGTVDGRIHGHSVQLCAGGVVRGDIIHVALGIEKGAIFEGASRRVDDPMAGAPVIVVRKKGE